MLNPGSPVPLYRQLSDLLLSRIREGQYPPGARIPSEHQLASEYRLGRPTIRQALDLLVRKGVLARRRGSGTFVREPQQQVDLFSLDGTSASLRRKGVVFDTALLAPIARVLVPAGGENPFAGRHALFLARLTRVGQEPVLLERIYLHVELFAGIEQMELQGRSLSAIAEERFYLRASSGRQTFRIGYAEKQEAGLLHVSPHTPLLVVARTLDFGRVPQGVFAELWCRTDQLLFSQTIGGTADA